MSILSSETLFHFTDSIIKLKSILKNEFYPRYSLESYPLDPEESSILEVGVPMVSFCDIPLSSVKEHVKLYGHYGIGMSKDWAEKKKLNPVLYFYNGSDLSLNIRDMFINACNALGVDGKPTQEELRIVVKGFFRMFMYIKPFKGDFKRYGNTHRDIKFYDEMEWRYVPPTSEEHDGIKHGLDKEIFKDQKILDEENKKLYEAKLSFEPHDIKYIIVNKEREISDMVNALKEIKLKYGPPIIEILTSRIITYKQIDEDF